MTPCCHQWAHSPPPSHAGCTRARVRTPTRTSPSVSVFKELSALNTNKASGPDGIPSWYSKKTRTYWLHQWQTSWILPFWSVDFQLRGRKRTLHPSRRPHLLVMLTNTWGPFLWPQFFLKLGKSLSLKATSSLPSLQKCYQKRIRQALSVKST